jgi:hypothetical protein
MRGDTVMDSSSSRSIALDQAVPRDGERVGRAPYRQLDSSEEVRKRAHVVLVTVGQKNARQARALRLEVRKIRVVGVDADVVVGERDPAVDDECAVRLLEGEAVHSDFAKPP